MKRKGRISLTALLAAALLMICTLPGLAADAVTPDGAGTDPGEGAVTAVPETPAATAQPATQPPQTQPPTAVPATTAPPETPVPATAAPTEAPGTVNLHLYVYTSSDTPAAGYTVQVGSSKTTTGADGLANFSGISVTQQSVTIAGTDGQTCTGKLYMSRASSTRVTDQAMGGTYGLDVARGQNELYLLTTFVPDGALLIRSATNSQPALPQPAATQEAAASADPLSAVALTATFLNTDSKGISGMRVTAANDAGQPLEATTNSSGQIDLPSVPYGHYAVTAEIPGTAADSFDLTIQPGSVTGVASNIGRNMAVNVSPTAKHLYLQFTQTAAGFVLSEASDSPISSGLSSMVIGIIVVAICAAGGIIAIVLVRRHRKKKTAAPAASAGASYTPQRKINYDPGAERLHPADERPKRTGGANKFDDRSKL